MHYTIIINFIGRRRENEYISTQKTVHQLLSIETRERKWVLATSLALPFCDRGALWFLRDDVTTAQPGVLHHLIAQKLEKKSDNERETRSVMKDLDIIFTPHFSIFSFSISFFTPHSQIVTRSSHIHDVTPTWRHRCATGRIGFHLVKRYENSEIYGTHIETTAKRAIFMNFRASSKFWHRKRKNCTMQIKKCHWTDGITMSETFSWKFYFIKKL